MKNDLYIRFLEFIKDHSLIHKNDSVLLAVSGGVDSMVMSSLFHRTGFKIGIAHCNFRLRGSDSDADEELVFEFARAHGIPFFTKRFDTFAFAKKNKYSIQMAARELRYQWFYEVIRANNFTWIATAHHEDDQAETILLNLVKGAIISGLQGIPLRNNNIIRPLLFSSKADLLRYASDNDIEFREDKSNLRDNYQRNYIRNRIIPLLFEINPDVVNSISKAAFPRSQVFDWLKNEIQSVNQSLEQENGGEIYYSGAAMQNSGLNAPLLYEILSHYGFTYTQVEDLWKSLDSTESAIFSSPQYEIIKDRNGFSIREKINEEGEEFQIYETDIGDMINGLRFEKIESGKIDLSTLSDATVALLDYQKLQFPLMVRMWRQGDKFKPLGMKGKKKVSDFLIDHKIPMIKKQVQQVLISGEEIAWLVGLRINEDFRINSDTKFVLRVSVDSDIN